MRVDYIGSMSNRTPHSEEFRKWFSQDNLYKIGLIERLQAALNSRIDQKVAQPPHTFGPTAHGKWGEDSGWTLIACLGNWRHGNVREADSHCLELFQTSTGKYFLVDQSCHGRFREGYRHSSQIIAQLPEWLMRELKAGVEPAEVRNKLAFGWFPSEC